MPRDTPSAQTKALHRIQIQSARQKLKLDTARAQKAMADAPNEDVVTNQFGRPIVAYKDMPELEAGDMALMEQEFHRLACPHVAVLKYRPGFEDRGYSEGHARDCWWFYDTGTQILQALSMAVLEGKVPDLLEQISDDELDVSKALSDITKFLMLEEEAKIQAAMSCGLTPEDFEAKNKAELAEIRESVEARFAARVERKAG